MPILCLEGPSAVGKSSTARYLAQHHEAKHIPEVNLLFKRPANQGPHWYYERQVERYQLAKSHSTDRLVILDGDPFQPVWYDLLFPSISTLSYEAMLDFYRSKLDQKELAWPDRYVLLSAPVAELRKRKQGDLNQQRKKFEAHLALVDCLPPYFARLESASPGLVLPLKADTVAESAQAVLEASACLEMPRDGVAVFDEIASWIRKRSAPGLSTPDVGLNLSQEFLAK